MICDNVEQHTLLFCSTNFSLLNLELCSDFFDHNFHLSTGLTVRVEFWYSYQDCIDTLQSFYLVNVSIHCFLGLIQKKRSFSSVQMMMCIYPSQERKQTSMPKKPIYSPSWGPKSSRKVSSTLIFPRIGATDSLAVINLRKSSVHNSSTV